MTPYRVRGASAELREEVRALLRDRDRLLATSTEDVLPRLHIEHHLFSPLLLNPREYGSKELRVSPSGLVRGEAAFLDDVVSYWRDHGDESHESQDLYIQRNLPHRGVGFFRRSGFYPDFLLWLVGQDGQRLRFVEPHGMHHGGISGNASKIEAFRDLDALNNEAAFRDAGVNLRGFILFDTERSRIPGAEESDDDELRTRHHLIQRTGGGRYLRSILAE